MPSCLGQERFYLREIDGKGVEKIQQTVIKVVPLCVVKAYGGVGMKLCLS